MSEWKVNDIINLGITECVDKSNSVLPYDVFGLFDKF
jgi:hypothetical protein